jgi:hypothetical protein
MRFVTNPQLILSLGEFETLNEALIICRDMDEETGKPENACEACPFQDDCTHMCSDCVYARAHKALKEIIDIAIVK